MVALARLDALVRDDPTAAPLARLQAEALRAMGPMWDESVPTFNPHCLAEGLPLLHRQVLRVDGERVRVLLNRLGRTASENGSPKGAAIEQVRAGKQLDVAALLGAVIMQDEAAVERIAAAVGIDAPLLATLGGLAALPLLLACGTASASVVEHANWREGLCPLCAAWPTLAELRGLERRRWLRCGRCGTGWEAADDGCIFCANDDFDTLGYLAPEDERESRRAMVCERCRGYLKTFATLGPLAPAELVLADLTSLELDMAAMEREYARPAVAAFPLRLTVEIASRRRGWLGRGRDG